MNLWSLQVFREVMRADSVSKAAQNLGRTQPALSATLAKLERHIGYDLFERKSGRLHPVPEAHYLLAEAEQVLERVSALEHSMRAGSGLASDQLRIACMPAIAEFFMPNVIADFAESHPHTRFSLQALSSAMVYDRISAQQFDVGLAESRPGTELVNEESFEIACVCALPADDPLAGRSFVTADDLHARPCATFLPDHFIARQLRDSFASAGVVLNVQFELQNGAAQYPLISQGLAFGVFSPLTQWLYQQIHSNSERICFVPFKPVINYRFAILTPAHRTLSRLAQRFVCALRAQLDTILLEIASANERPQSGQTSSGSAQADARAGCPTVTVL